MSIQIWNLLVNCRSKELTPFANCWEQISTKMYFLSVIFCCITNHPALCGLMQHFPISVLLASSRAGLSWTCSSVSHGVGLAHSDLCIHLVSLWQLIGARPFCLSGRSSWMPSHSTGIPKMRAGAIRVLGA